MIEEIDIRLALSIAKKMIWGGREEGRGGLTLENYDSIQNDMIHMHDNFIYTIWYFHPSICHNQLATHLLTTTTE